MKGLLLKDLYMSGKYCRVFLLIVVVFFGMSLMSFGMFLMSGSTFFLLAYPCILVGLIPASLISYDEREKWDVYSGTLPCSRRQLVSCKYLVGLIGELPVICITTVLYALGLFRIGAFDPRAVLVMAAVFLLLGLIGPAATLPFMFRFGAEKGRIAYFAVIILLCGGSAAFGNIQIPDGETILEAGTFLPQAGVSFFLAVLAVLLYAVSWKLSIAFYKKREL